MIARMTARPAVNGPAEAAIQVSAPAMGRLECIDAAKGLAIALVVWGHVVARDMPVDARWYEVSKQVVYTFHMPFFMFLSGLLFFRSLNPVQDWRGVGAAVGRRFWRLMPAYFLFAAIVIVGKWLAQHFVHVDNPVISWSGVIAVIFYPVDSPAAFLWYVHTLFLLSALSLVVMHAAGGRLAPLVMLAVGAQVVEFPDFLGFSRVSYFMPFFVAGGLAVTNWLRYVDHIDRFGKFWVLVFGAALVCYAVGFPATLLAAASSVPALHFASRRSAGTLRRLLVWLGGYSFAIYLMNTMAIGATKATLAPFFAWRGVEFALVYAPVLMLAGLLLPVFAKRFFIPRLPWLDRITS